MKARKIVAAAGCAALVTSLLGGCATTGPSLGTWKPAPVGSGWVTEQRNTGSFGKDIQVSTSRLADMDWKGSPAVALRTANGILLQQPQDGRWLAFLTPDGKPVTTFDPPAGWPRPFEVGASFKRTQKVNNLVTGRTGEYELTCTAMAWEKVTVRAGTFDALRVDCSSSVDSQDSFWTSPAVHPFVKAKSVRGPNNPNGPGTQETELVKAPS